MTRNTITALLSLLVLTGLVACERVFGPRDGAMFCRPNEFLGMVVEIDFRENRGMWEDVGLPIQPCGDPELACISFPLLLSVPPNDGWDSEVPYSWEVGPAEFMIAQIDGNENDNYLLTARDSSGVMYFTYNLDRGVLEFQLGESEEDRWKLCGGRLTFDRLKAWLDSGRLQPPLNWGVE